MGKNKKFKKGNHQFNPNPNPRAWTPVRGKDALYHTSYQKQHSEGSGGKWYSTVSERFNKVDLFKEEYTPGFDGRGMRPRKSRKKLRNFCLQSNIDRAIGGYQREQKLLTSIEELKQQIQLNVNMKEEKTETDGERSRSGDQKSTPEKLNELSNQIQSLESELRYMRQCRIPYLSRMYELKAGTRDSTSLSAKICGFVTNEENMYEILFALVREKILPEGKQFIVNYVTPVIGLRTTFDGINALDTDKWLCELIEFRKEDQTPRVLEEYSKGDLRGIFLPLERGFLNNEIAGAMANTGYLINFFTMPLIQTSNMNDERVGAYWERFDYSKYVGQNHRPLTVVDFVSPLHLMQYEEMYRRRGFVFDQASIHNFDASIAKIQAPPLMDSYGTTTTFSNYVGESQRVKSEVPVPASEAITISSDSEDDSSGEYDADKYMRGFSFDIPAPVVVKSEFPNEEDQDYEAPTVSFGIPEPTLVKTEMKNEGSVSSTHTHSRKRHYPEYAEDEDASGSGNNFGQENSIGFTEESEDGKLVRDYGHGDPNYVPDYTTHFSESGYTQNSDSRDFNQSGSRFYPREEQNNASPFQFQYTRRQSTSTATTADPNSNFNYCRR